MKRSACLAMIVLAGCAATSVPSGSAPPAVAGPSSPAATPSAPVAASAPVEPRPPTAAKRPYVVKSANGDRDDPYYWLRDDTRKSAEVLGYLTAENSYTEAVLGPARSLEDKLVGEMKSRIQDDDTSVPVLEDGYWYYTRFAAGQEHPVYVRRKGTMDAPEQVVLDGNELARGQAFFAFGGHAVSHDGQFVAWTEDTVGRRQFVLRIRDLRTGKILPDTATNVAASRDVADVAWANDNKTVFYVGKDTTTLREDRVFRHTLGSAEHALAFREPDGQFYVSIKPTQSRRYVQIIEEATTTSEVRVLDADRPAAAVRVVMPRERGHLYLLDHLDGRFVIRTNAGAKNFRIISVADAKVANRAAWRDVIPASPDVLIEKSFMVSRNFVAATVRRGGLSQVEVVPTKGAAFFVDADEPAYVMKVDEVADADAKHVRYIYTSPITPSSTFELDVATRERKRLKVQPVPGYDPASYVTEYLHAKAGDGTSIPVTVLYRKDTKRDVAPLLVYGYGSYGSSSEPKFDISVLPLLDRGWVRAIAHVRGGEEMGRGWYEDGKLMHKRNTFTDFIAATEYLITSKYGARDQVYAMGGSAGGLLMGAVLNLRPELYRGVVAAVPFVDVVTTMLDESIPLTTNEFDEWGNPQDKAAYDYMLGYSPYDNVAAKPYPSIYVRTGLWDSQVQYFEPAKWVAKLRATKTDDNLILLDTDMAAGHGGKSGRFDRLRDAARYMTFLLHVHDRPDRRPGFAG